MLFPATRASVCVSAVAGVSAETTLMCDTGAACAQRWAFHAAPLTLYYCSGMASACPCDNLSRCTNGTSPPCSRCLVGFTGELCNVTFADVDPNAYYAVTYLNVALWAMTLLACAVVLVASIVSPNTRGTNVRLSAILALASIFMASACHLASWASDRYRFHAAAGHYLTGAYDVGMAVLANLGIAFVVWAYAVLLTEWISIRSMGVRKDAKVASWPLRLRLFFVAACAVCAIVGVVMACLRLVMVQITTDTIFFAILAVTAFLLAFFISFFGIRTIMSLATFREHNRKVMLLLAKHVVAVGLSLAVVSWRRLRNFVV